MLKQEYFSPSKNYFIRIEEFSKLNEKLVIELVLYWFNENHQNPAENCPYDDGEYLYIYGGPITATEAIDEEFGDIISNDLIEKILIEIPEKDNDFSLIPDYRWSDYTLHDPYLIFQEHIDDIRRLSILKNRDEHLCNKYLGLLFINLLTVLESFLADTLICAINEDERCLERYSVILKFNNKEIKNLNVVIEDEKEKTAYLNKIMAKINSITFHTPNNLNIFTKILNISISDYSQKLKKYSYDRNNIVHRNGKSKNHTLSDTKITLEKLNNTIVDIENLVNEINIKILKDSTIQETYNVASFENIRL